ncbi:hypothetical protein X801_08216, partial [Opisthorchis viverrini]
HLLQDINIKTIIDTTATVCQQSVYREYKISLATILVPLDSEQPEFDLLANQPVNFTKSSLLTETHTDPTLFLLELEHQEIASLVDVVQDELKGHTVPGWENKPCISIQAWRDVAALIQAMRLKPKPHNFERTRLLRLIKPGLLSWDKPRLQTNSTTACSVLLHLPCDASQAYLTMQCLRL